LSELMHRFIIIKLPEQQNTFLVISLSKNVKLEFGQSLNILSMPNL